MNFQRKLLAVAVMGFALAAPAAHASIDTGAGGANQSTSGNGELFFSLWSDNGTVGNTADDVSYTRDLGVNINDWADAASPFNLTAQKTTAGYTQSFTANALLSSFLGSVPVGAVLHWNVVGNDSIGAKRFVSTAAEGTATLPNQSTVSSRAVNTAIIGFAGSTNTLANTQNSTTNNSVINNSNTATFADGAAYAGGVAWGTNLGGKTAFDTTGAIGSQLPFFLQYETSTTQTGNALQKQFTSAVGSGFDGSAAYWTLDASGNLSYNVNAVPEADTWAMFAAGLLVVGAIARRRLAA